MKFKWMVLACALGMQNMAVADKQPVKAAYIPLADHYPGIVAYEKYRDEMQYADFSIEQMSSWDLLRAYFRTGDIDLAFIISPMALDMYAEKADFRWISLMHRDGNALAINHLMNQKVHLPESRLDRKPNASVAKTFAEFADERGESVQVGVPSLLATHTVILYKYLKDQGLTLGLGVREDDADVVAIAVPPPKSPAFINGLSNRGKPAAFEQSLPWADVVETKGLGKVAWYSKDVLQWPKGHVECIVIATDKAIAEKRAAIAEVVRYLHKAGKDIDHAREEGGAELAEIAELVGKHIPAHNPEAIISSLDITLDVIHYHDLNIDVAGMEQVMSLALEAGVLQRPVDVNAFADPSFYVELDEHER